MQTHQDIWFTVSDQQEHVFFRAYNLPNPILDFVPWPIRVPGIVFPDGTQMFTAGGGNNVPSILAGAGISVTTGVGTVTISNTQSQTPWLQNVNGGGFSLSNVLNIAANSNITAGGNVTAGALVSTGVISATGGISSGGNINASGSFVGNTVSSSAGGPLSLNPSGGDIEAYDDININDPTDAGFSYRINNIPLATFDSTTGGIDLVNISTINGAAPGGGGGSPAGANTQVQINTNGAFGATPNLTFDPNANALTVSDVDNYVGNLQITGGDYGGISSGFTPDMSGNVGQLTITSGTIILAVITRDSSGNVASYNQGLLIYNTGNGFVVNIPSAFQLQAFGGISAQGNVNLSLLPTSSAGLNTGDVWNNSGVLNIV